MIDYNDIDAVSAEISRLEKEKKNIEEQSIVEPIEEYCIDEELFYLYKVKDELIKKRNQIRNEFKQKILKNFRILHENCDVKIGVIEKESGNSIGYVSRLQREENSGLPNLEFLVTAAKTLKVPLDFLVNGDLESLTPTEYDVLTFLHRVIDDTRNDRLEWKIHSKTNIAAPAKIIYNSLFFPERDIVVRGGCYEAFLPGTSNTIEVNCVGEWDLINKENGLFYFEILLSNEVNEKNPICCSANTCEDVATAIRNLYKEIQYSISHIHINADAKETIRSYMNYVTLMED